MGTVLVLSQPDSGFARAHARLSPAPIGEAESQSKNFPGDFLTDTSKGGKLQSETQYVVLEVAPKKYPGKPAAKAHSNGFGGIYGHFFATFQGL
jgi:hypothetical protein